ncbi:MAG: VIT family protein, partial [Sediminibacterium sp.]
MELEEHYTTRSGWLRAAVLGANDGILSTTSLAIGIAAASTTREPIVLAALAGLVAGALSMAAGEYVSVSSQSDIEIADLTREKQELENMPEIELRELAKLYQQRGLEENLAMQVAEQLTAHDALGAHAKDELGINEITQAKPLQAALASAASFITGGMLPMLVSIFAPLNLMVIYQYGFSIIFLAVSAIVAAKAGGSNI